ncbi:MAG TPA: esterase-like activity of phytase family protein [Steroidobacteraceae bacterium]|nr:esterase-like activity of phytase family protein [Steroidobacteraceae bacterium]
MLASRSHAFSVCACLVAGGLLLSASADSADAKPGDAKPAAAKTAPVKPAAKPAAANKTSPAVGKPAIKPAPKPAKPAPPPPVELIGLVVMPSEQFRGGPPSGQFDGQGRRAPEPRFDSQPVQGISSIKPGPTPGAWWALSDNGFGAKWNSPDYRLGIYLFDLRPRTQAGPDSRVALQAVIELSDPARFFPWLITEEGTPERFLTGADADPESMVAMPDDTFWIGDEFGPWLLHFSEDGDLLSAPVELPDAVYSVDHPLVLARGAPAKLEHSRGFEAMDLAGDGKTLVTILEGTVAGDAPRSLRVQRYDTAAGKWLAGTLIYELDADTVSVTDMSRIDGNRFVVIERDGEEGDAAKAKRVYSIDLDRAQPGKPLAKKLVIDLLQIGNAHGLIETLAPGAPFRFPYLTTESIQVLDRRHVVIANDNNYPAKGGRGPNVPDATEWIWLELTNPL